MTAAVKRGFPKLPDWYEDWLAETDTEMDRARARIPIPEIGPCRWCRHNEHGFRCVGCNCDSTYTPRDDSWRPYDDWTPEGCAGRLMHDYGVDGYVATMASRNFTEWARWSVPPSPHKVLQMIKGRAA